MVVLIYLVARLNGVIWRHRFDQMPTLQADRIMEVVFIFGLKARTHHIGVDERIEFNTITKLSRARS
jgi:hypothetical protein